MNFSAILINVALRAAERAQKGDVYASHAVFTAIVFAAMAIEALLNEQAYVEIHERKRRSKDVFAAVENGARGFERIQAILLYLYGCSLEDGANPANEMKLLITLRNGLTHYRFERPPKKVLAQLAQRGLFEMTWESMRVVSWPAFATPKLARWAYETACLTATAIAGIVEAADGGIEVDSIRSNFDVAHLNDLLRGSEAAGDP